jgi:hypothetical protein
MREGNLQFMGEAPVARVDKTEYLTDLFSEIIEKMTSKYPELAGLSFTTNAENERNSFASAVISENWLGDIVPEGVESFAALHRLDDEVQKNPEAYAPDLNHVSELVGTNISPLPNRVEILQAFVFLHELGHIEDFLNIKLRAGDGPRALQEFTEDIVAGNNQMPIPGLTIDKVAAMDDSDFYKLYAENADRLRELEIFSIAELTSATGEAQRHTPVETRADQFAKENIGLFFAGLGETSSYE